MRTAVLKLVVFIAAAALTGTAFAAYGLFTAAPVYPTARAIPAWSPELPPTPVGGDEGPPQHNFVETFARPVFSPLRRPFAPSAPEGPEPAPEPIAAAPPPAMEVPPDASGLALKGVMLGDATAKALIAAPEEPDGRWFAVGETIRGFRLSSISDASVILSGGEQPLVLQLYVDNP
jgi:hypothetical protein